MKEHNIIHHGNALKVLRVYPDNSFDSIVTDPPYEIGFMNRQWDKTGIAYDVSFWRECLRVLKPGGHLLAFSSTRTYHRMVCAIEDAGFEIRDMIEWLYLSGFPKSMDVGKAFDRRKHGYLIMEEFKAYLNEKRKEKGLSLNDINIYLGVAANGGGVASAVMGDKDTTTFPAKHQYEKLKILLELDGRYDELIESAEREKIGEKVTKDFSHHKGSMMSKETTEEWSTQTAVVHITAPATSLAKQWDGWGTALKPAHEPIVMARKPIEKTVAYNVEKYRTGAVNIAASRIKRSEEDRFDYGIDGDEGGVTKHAYQDRERVAYIPDTEGRFPANCITLDADEWFSKWFNVSPQEVSKKADAADRNMMYDGRDIRDIYNMKNDHPTVKPVAIIRWLMRLVTPPGGVVLDPFVGSGTGGVAARQEGFRFVGIDLDEHNVELARARSCGEQEPTTLFDYAFVGSESK